MTPRLLAALVVASALIGSVSPPVQAQTNQPIYPVYDGFIKSPDGTLILSFAYFSHNADPVTVSPGPTNAFAPEPADRQQPTRFLPGHHRFQCIIVVGPPFDGKLRWTLSYGGTTTSTSDDMLQYSWELEDASVRQAMRGIDIKTAPKGVCLNRPPVVRVLGLPAGRGVADRQASRALSVTLPEALTLFGSVDDEGLPREGKLAASWKTINGPGTVTFSDANSARTRASFSAAGLYELELMATDSQLEGRTRVTIIVKAAP